MASAIRKQKLPSVIQLPRGLEVIFGDRTDE
jgi:hypothetical protein